ncbi:MAG: MFS family permease [Candidatus Poriferisodalaceae bacterium]|jgi:MFS family permease
MAVWCGIAITLTAPGQTIGVSAYLDSFKTDLNLTDNSVGLAYMVGTLSGAVALPFIGRWIDVFGVRRSMFVIACVFSSAVALTGAVQGVFTLGLAFAGIRMFGQGSLSLAGTTGIALWFDVRRGYALAWVMTLSAGLMALAPLALTQAIDTFGWRLAWVVVASFVFVIVAPMSWFLIVDRPGSIGQEPDGIALAHDAPSRTAFDFTVAESVRTLAFWSLALVMFATGALITGLTFHHFTIMEGQGLTKSEAALVFVPQMVATFATSFAVSWMTDGVSSRILQPFSMLTLAAAMLWLERVTPGFNAVVYGVLTGLAGGAARGVFSAYYPKWFGVTHAGAIRGVASSIGVAASAVGPIMVSFGKDLTGSYRTTMFVLISVPIAGLVASAIVGAPTHPNRSPQIRPKPNREAPVVPPR